MNPAATDARIRWGLLDRKALEAALRMAGEAREDRRRLVAALSWITGALVLALVALLCLPSCAPSYSQGDLIDEVNRAWDPDYEPTMPAVRCPVAGNPVWFGLSLRDRPEYRALFLHRIDAWLQAYPCPGVRVYVFKYTQSPHSYRMAGPDALLRFGWWLEARTDAQGKPTWSEPVVGDLPWEVRKLFWGYDDPPPLGLGSATYPPEDAARLARAIALAK